MGCHWHSGIITGHDEGITLVGFVYLNSSYDFVGEDEDHDDPTPSAIVRGVGGVGGQFFVRKGMLLKCVLQTHH